jgi:hypothetical protein
MARTQEFMVSCGSGKIPVKLPADHLRLARRLQRSHCPMPLPHSATGGSIMALTVEFVQQRLRILEVSSVEPLCKPA